VFGNPCDVEKIQEIADQYGLKVIYDAAHAFGLEIDDKGIGCFGDATMFSFHATKLFHTAEGGALSFRDKNLKKRVDLLKNFGIKNENEVVMPGINGKMNEIQAALGLHILDHLQSEISKRKELLKTYRECLSDVEGIYFFDDIPNVKNSYQYFAIRIDEKVFGKSRDYIYNELKHYNIYTRKYFFPLCSDYTCYKYLPSANKSNLAVAHKIANEVLSMPFYGELSTTDIEKICSIIKKFAS
jgi:dTDP-4-amino-4,6-dideoxygalactose transaminase